MGINHLNQKSKCRLLAYVCLLVLTIHGSRVYGQNCSPPGATIATPDTLSCSNRTITLYGSSSTAGASFSWSGPNGVSSFSQNFPVSIAGTYYLVTTSPSGGCTSTASVTVVQDTVQPDAQTSVSGVMTCDHPTITVSGISTTPGVSYSWIGPGNFTSTSQNLSVTVSGGYTLMVKDVSNGCISTATAYVDKNVELPTASAYVSGKLTCVTGSVQLTSSSATSGVSYSWTGPGFGSAVLAQNTTTSTDGPYTVTTKNPVNGCTSSASVEVIKDISTPTVSITASTDTITCTAINADLSGSSNTIGVTYTWSGTDLAPTEVQNITVASAGTYVLKVVKAENGCSAKDSVAIAVDVVRPTVTATASSSITCRTNIVTLNGSSNVSPASYKWTGPSAFGTSYIQNPQTSVSGGYILRVTNLRNGCMTTKPLVVTKNVTPPASVTASNNGPLTCATDSVTLTGYSSTTNTTYSWTGSSSTYTGKTVSVGDSGTYILTVKNETNGCTASTTTQVTSTKSLPASVTATNNGPITCLVKSVTLSGNSATSGVNYQWKNSGGTVISTNQNYDVSASGVYTLVVTNPANGCSSTKLTAVTSNTTKPALIVASNDGPLTCSFDTSTLNASSSTSTVTYKWSGPNNFASTSKNPTTRDSGTYKVVFKNTSNGCTDSTTTYLAKNTDVPGVSTGPAPTITCSATSATLSASSSTSGVTYNWSGPNSFASSEREPATTKDGDYTVTVTNPANNCTSVASVTVALDTLHPAGVTASAPDSLTCSRLNVSISASTSTTGVNYSWTGPGGFTSSSQNPNNVTKKGNYIVEVTKTSNNCKSYANTTVVTDSVPPANVSATASGILNCVNANVTLTGSSSTPGVTYAWTGPGVSSSSSTATAATAATYYLTVTNPHNGCTATTNIVVGENHTSPVNVIASSPDKLTCSIPNVNISASTATSGVEYKWTGPDGFTSNEQSPSVSVAGTYNVTVTHTVSKCEVPTSTVVSNDTVTPANVNATYSKKITCYDRSVYLTGSSTTGRVKYSWDGPNDFSSTLQMPSVNAGGLYTLTVTDSINGCYKTKTLILPVDTAHPADVTAVATDKLDCTTNIVELIGNSSTSGVSYEWYYSGAIYTQEASAWATEPGDYTLIVKNPINGCTTSRTAQLIGDYVAPVCVLDVANGSTVVQNSVNTISAEYHPTYTYAWNTGIWTPINGQTTQTLTYKAGNTGSSATLSVTVIDTSNNCDNSCSVTLSAVVSKSAVAENLLPLLDMTVSTYPVPSAGKVFIDIASPEQTDAIVTVYNTNGAVIANLFNNSLEANQNYKLVFNAHETLPAGAYICVVKTKAKTVLNKIIIK